LPIVLLVLIGFAYRELFYKKPKSPFFLKAYKLILNYELKMKGLKNV